MIKLIKPYNGNEVGTTFPLMSRGEARLLVKRGYAEFINPAHQAAMEASDLTRAEAIAEQLTSPESETESAQSDAQTESNVAPNDSAGGSADVRRGRKKAT